MAEQADAQDLKSCGTNIPYRFDSGCRHCQRWQLIEYVCVAQLDRALGYGTYDLCSIDDTQKTTLTQVLFFKLHYAPVAQLDRASGYGPEGRVFESCPAH